MAEEPTGTLEDMLKSKGFSSIDDVFRALDSTKADLSKHKTRADTLTKAEQELENLRKAQQEREDAEKTEIQKLIDKLAQKEKDAEAAMAKAAQAERTSMLERGLSEHLSAVPEKLRPFAAEHLRTVLPHKEWADAETLGANIKTTLEQITGLLPEEMRTVPAGGSEQHRQTDTGAPAGGPVTGFNFVDAVKAPKT